MIDCDGHIVNDEYWNNTQMFIRKNLKIEELDVEVLGYFPYHTARLRPIGVSQVYLPRALFSLFETILTEAHFNDNKAVYICKPIKTFTGVCPFALMFKDDYVMVGVWTSVVGYDNRPLKANKKK